MFEQPKYLIMNTSSTKWVMGHKITAHEITGDYDLMFGETPAKVTGPPLHLHNSFTESFLIVEGEMQFMVNGTTTTVKAGESVDIPPNTVHTFANVSDRPCKFVNIHSPKGFRRFFEELGIPEDEENAVEKSLAPEVIEKVMTTAAEYDMVIKI